MRHLRKLRASKDDGNQNIWSGIKGLWNEVIEVSTYGPSERKMLKVQRERQIQMKDELEKGEPPSQISPTSEPDNELDFSNEEEWLESFKSAKKKQAENSFSGVENLEFDGYALQDLLVAKCGASLDIEFQRFGDKLYCTVLPILGFGTPLRSRHDTELDYLMHLQGVIEILRKYDNLEYFLAFVETTKKTPKRGTDAVLCRLNLSEEQAAQIIES